MLITKRQLEAHEFTIKDVTREALRYMHISPLAEGRTQTGKVTATDGSYLVQVRPPVDLPATDEFPRRDGVEFPAIDKPLLIDAETAKVAAKAVPKHPSVPAIANALVAEVTDRVVTLLTTDLQNESRHVSPVTGVKYVDIDGVIPRDGFDVVHEQAKKGEGTYHRICVEANKLAQLMRYMGKGEKAARVEILVPKNSHSAIVIRRKDPDGHQIDALLMPMSG